MTKNNGRKSRTKGHGFERWCAIQMRDIFPKARRHLEYQDGQCFGVDLAETGPYKFQCKRFRDYAPINAIMEVQCEPELGDVPVLVTQGDHKPAMAVLPFEDFIRLVKKGI